MPKVSVVLPAFNRLQFLRPAVESVLAQTFADWELLIADDGSGEDTRNYLRGLRDRRIKVLWLAHSGSPASVRNTALREATGDYVAFLDSDDLWVADKLAIQLSALQSQTARPWNYSAYTCIDASGNPRVCPGRAAWTPYEGPIFERLLGYEADIVTASVMVERRLILSLGCFDEAQAVQEDHDLWMRLAIAGDAGVIDQPLVAMRLHDQHYGKGGLAAQIDRHRSLAKIRRLVTDSPRRMALDAALAGNALQLALAYAGSDRRAALAALSSDWRLIVRHRRWRSLAKVCLKWVMPRWALTRRRALTGS